MPAFRLFTGFALPFCLALAAHAAETATKDVTATSGKPQKIGVFTHVTGACANGKVDMRLAENPAKGTITTKPAKAKAGAMARCPKLAPEAVAVFYQSKKAYKGADHFAIEIKNVHGEIVRQDYAVTVR